MNQPKTAGLYRSVRNCLLAVAILLFAWSVQAAAQQSLGDIVKEYGFDWLISKWMTKTDEGEKILITYKWALDKHLVTIDYKGGDYEYRSIVFYMPAEDEVVQVGVDNKGGTWKGTWDAEGDKAVMKVEKTEANGKTEKMVAFLSKVDDQTMKAELYAVNESGELADKPLSIQQFKHKDIKTEKKAVEKASRSSRKKQKEKKD